MSSSAGHHWSRPTVFYNYAVKWIFYLVVVFFITWSIWGLWVPFDRLLLGVQESQRIFSQMIPPNFGSRQRTLIWTGIIESLSMSIIATTVGVTLALPVAFMSAKNIAPTPIYFIGRMMASGSRTFHSLILALVMVKLLGVGPLAGITTMSILSVGFFAKLLSEDIEDINPEQIEAVRATGANRFQVLLYGVLPQILPRVIGLSVYTWDINLRSSTIVGIVGAGGIGITLSNSFNAYQYGFSAAILLVIITIVLFGEFVSAVVRRWYQ